jgi:uncharacterized protein YdeI (YjbR/CyaY-like superfamily)
MINETEYFCPTSKQDWRIWLEKNHKTKEGIWLVMHKKSSPTANLNWSEAVDEALCFGWIDSTKKTMDSQTFKQYFGKRKEKSTWSKINKTKILNLLDQGLVSEMGLKSIDIAQKNGSWTILDSVENLEIPFELAQEFDKKPESKDYFLSLSKSVQKSLLHWVTLAKRPETRLKRAKEFAENAFNRTKPKQFR